MNIEITGFSGTYPFDVYVCDVTLSYCYLTNSGVNTIPITIYPPIELAYVSSLVVKIVDSLNCEYFQPYVCVTPTPTPSITPTVTPSMVVDCNCITFDNQAGTSNYNFSLTQCDNTILESVVYSGTVVYYCGKLPSADPEVVILIGGPCYSNGCPTPSFTPTPTPSYTPGLPYLLQEDTFFILQEDGTKIIIT